MTIINFLKDFALIYAIMGTLTFLCAGFRTGQWFGSFTLGLFWPYILIEND